MTVKDYLNNVRGKRIDTDGAPSSQPYQCADLIKDFLRRCYNINFNFTLPGKNPRGFAKSIYINFSQYAALRGKAVRIKYTPGFVPRAGDIVVWDGNVKNLTGEAGHVAIATGKGDSSYFISLDQNWGKKYYVAETKHSYYGILGVIRMTGSTKRTTIVDLNVRRGPGTGYSIAYTLKAGEEVTVLEDKGDWVRIGDGQWVSAKYLA